MVIEDIYVGFPFVDKTINVLEMVCENQCPSFPPGHLLLQWMKSTVPILEGDLKGTKGDQKGDQKRDPKLELEMVCEDRCPSFPPGHLLELQWMKRRPWMYVAWISRFENMKLSLVWIQKLFNQGRQRKTQKKNKKTMELNFSEKLDNDYWHESPLQINIFLAAYECCKLVPWMLQLIPNSGWVDEGQEL